MNSTLVMSVKVRGEKLKYFDFDLKFEFFNSIIRFFSECPITDEWTERGCVLNFFYFLKKVQPT